MQGITEQTHVLQPAGKAIGQRGRKKQDNTRNRNSRKTAAPTSKTYRSDFLNQKFEPIPVSLFNTLYSSENYMYLYDSIERYCELSGIEFNILPDVIDFSGLLGDFAVLLPVNKESALHPALYVDEDRIKAKVYQVVDSGTLYYVPIKILEEIEGEFRYIITLFLQWLCYSQKFSMYEEYIESWYFQDQLDIYADDKDVPEDYLEYLRRYESGDIYDLFCEVEQSPTGTLDSLEQNIKSYVFENKKQEKLCKLMLDGIALFRLDKSIFEYTMFDGDRSNGLLTIDNVFRFVYDDDDILQMIIEMVNNESQEGSEFISSTCVELYPDMESIDYDIDRFPYDFINWISKLISALYEY